MGIHDTNDSTVSERMIRLVADRVDYRYSLWVIIHRVAVRATFTLFRDGSTPHAEMDGLREPGTISTQYLKHMGVSTLTLREKESGAPVGVEDEGNVLHLAVGELLLEADAQALEACAGLLDVVDGDGDVAEAAAGVGVAVGVALEVGVGLCAVVVGELEDALAVEAVLGVGALAVVVGEEVEGERLELVL